MFLPFDVPLSLISMTALAFLFGRDVCQQADPCLSADGRVAKSEVCLYLAVIVMVVSRSGTARVSANQTRLPVASNVLRLLRAVLLTKQSAATGLLPLQERGREESLQKEQQSSRRSLGLGSCDH